MRKIRKIPNNIINEESGSEQLFQNSSWDILFFIVKKVPDPEKNYNTYDQLKTDNINNTH